MSQEASEINPLAFWRAKSGLTVEELSKLSGVGTATITRIENWRVEPTLRTLGRLAKALDIDLEKLTKLANIPKNLPPTVIRDGGRYFAAATITALLAALQIISKINIF